MTDQIQKLKTERDEMRDLLASAEKEISKLRAKEQAATARIEAAYQAQAQKIIDVLGVKITG